MLVLKAGAARLFGMKAMARFLRKPPPGSPESVRRLYAERPGYADWAQAKVLATSPVMARAMIGRAARPAPTALPELRSLDLPVLVIVGEHDMPGFVDGVPAHGRCHPGRHVRRCWTGAAHSPQLETPDAWWAALTGFLDALADATSPHR